MSLSRIARRLTLPVFRRVNVGDITIRHHWTGDALRLHSFKHKGYWWYGRNREQETMELFAKLIPPGTTVIEIGGHIGYMAQYFSMLAGPPGHVFCFEPSPENLPYIKMNAARCPRQNISIIEAAAGERDGTAPFFYESITGQNSTATRDFKGLEANSRFNGLPAEYKTCTVPMRSVDSFVTERAIQPGFVKIDAEGGERDILRGMTETLARGTRTMVEVNTHNEDVFAILTDAKYALFDASKKRMLSGSPEEFGGNIFAIHGSDAEGLALMETPGTVRK